MGKTVDRKTDDDRRVVDLFCILQPVSVESWSFMTTFVMEKGVDSNPSIDNLKGRKRPLFYSNDDSRCLPNHLLMDYHPLTITNQKQTKTKR